MLRYLYNSNPPPEGIYEGMRALTVQSYTEANAKNGVQHEGSTIINGVLGGASNDTIFITGNLPVSLKARLISYTGDGVKAEIYSNPIYSGGISAPYQNASNINPVVGQSTILVGATITDDGLLAFAPAYHIGNTSRQGQGATATFVGNEKILAPCPCLDVLPI